MPHIVVIGSINMDLVCRTPRMPEPGETILGGDFLTVPGGKGANQAVAAAKLAPRGMAVHMVGRVGADDFGDRLLAGLRTHHVGTRHVTVTENDSSGVGMILVDRKGENSIVVAPGANARLVPADVDAATDVISSAAAVVMQLEIPLPTVAHVIALCRRAGVPCILDPAPVPTDALPAALWDVDLLTPNQTEAEQLLHRGSTGRMKRARRTDAKLMASQLKLRGPKSVVLKLGSRGSLSLHTNLRGTDEFLTARPFKVRVVDTTAAGDAFTGALAVARAEGLPIRQALRFANAAGALCCATLGAQPALPTRAAVQKLLRQG